MAELTWIEKEARNICDCNDCSREMGRDIYNAGRCVVVAAQRALRAAIERAAERCAVVAARAVDNDQHPKQAYECRREILALLTPGRDDNG